MRRFLPLLCMLVLLPAADAAPPERVGATPPGLELRSIEEFGPGAGERWEIRHGRNVRVEASWDAGDSLSAVRIAREDEEVTAGAMNYVDLQASVQADPDWAEWTGIRVALGWATDMDTWAQLRLTTANGSFQHELRPYAYAGGAIRDRLLPFTGFRGAEGRTFQPADIEQINLVVYGRTATLYLDALQLYRPAPEQCWMELRTNADDSNVFERGAPIELRFSMQGQKSPDIAGFRYEVRDYWGERAAAGAVMEPDGLARRTVAFPSDVPGFFEVRAWWIRTDGTSDEESCLRESGSMPFGVSTFAVMPRTIEENRKEMTQGSFFGLHGATHNLNDLIGAAWHLPHHRWIWSEPQRPDRSDGTAPWAIRRTAAGPAPAHHFAVLNFTQHLRDIPEWARADTTEFPAWKNWDEWLAFVRDSVRAHVARYPHMDPRIYDLAWEPDLQMGHGDQLPTMTPKDMVELYARTVPVIRAEDPEARIAGPCPSGVIKDTEWYRELFDAGLIEYLDIISLHPYHSPPPEQSDLAGRIRTIRELAREYAGRDLPIYATEYGYRTARGSDSLYREHAQWLTRANCILKGEGVRVAMPFYGYDYPGDGSYGICFNLEPKLKWNPKRVAPKPAVPALAAQVAALNQAKPVGPMDAFGPGVRAYAFDKNGATVVAVWAPEGEQRLQLPNLRPADALLIDIMGRVRRGVPGAGPLEIEVGPDIQYVIHSPRRAGRP